MINDEDIQSMLSILPVNIGPINLEDLIEIYGIRQMADGSFSME